MPSLTQDYSKQTSWAESNEASPKMNAKHQVTYTTNGESERQLSQLLCTIEGEIIPRLMLAWRAPPDRSRVLALPAMTSSKNVVEFTGLILSSDFTVAMGYIEALQARGVSLELICLNLLAPTARRLGDLWSDDLCDFTQVTLGLCQLHRVLRELDPAVLNTDTPKCISKERHALIVPVPGEQHTFGLFMVIEFFRRAGWDVSSDFIASDAELIRLVHDQWFAVVGFSLSCERHIEALATSIRNVRRASCNRSVGIMVGGQLFNEHPELVARVGADATAADGRQATLQAENLLALLKVNE